jgi:ABC-type glutathione transport system ATPase component
MRINADSCCSFAFIRIHLRQEKGDNLLTNSQIVATDLSKQYRVPERESGLLASLRSLGKRRYRTVDAVQDVNFTVEEGEMVGLLGPNGAGKNNHAQDASRASAADHWRGDRGRLQPG